MSRPIQPHAEQAHGVLEGARREAEAHRARAGMVLALCDPLPAHEAPGATRILMEVSGVAWAQVYDPAGWVTLRRCLSREAAETYLRQREAGNIGPHVGTAHILGR